MTATSSEPRYVLPAPFEHVPVHVGPHAVDAALASTSLTKLSEFTSLNDDTVVFRTEMMTLVVQGTDAVTINVAPEVHPDLVDAILYGYAMRLLLLHAGVFSLHGSLVRVGDRTVAIAGHSGAGKSTTVSHLATAHGATVLIDDVLPITVADGIATAHPFDRPVHLLPDAATRLGLDATGVSDDPASGIGKLVANIASATGPVVVDHLVMLTLRAADAPEDSDPLTITTVTGAERLRYVVRTSNSTGLMSFGARADPYLAWAMQLASAVDVTHIVRSPGTDTLDAVARHIVG
jgi:hypothetical protein